MNTDKHGFNGINRRKQRERRGGKRQNHKEDCKFEIRKFKAEDLRSLTKLLRIVVRNHTNRDLNKGFNHGWTPINTDLTDLTGAFTPRGARLIMEETPKSLSHSPTTISIRSF